MATRVNTERLPEISGAAKTELDAQIDRNRVALLAGSDATGIRNIGETVLVDALRRRPKIADVLTAPPSFQANVERLADMHIQPDVAFGIVGEAVVIARNYTGRQDSFTA